MSVSKQLHSVETSFEAIVEIARRLAISLQRETTVVVSGIMALSGLIAGAINDGVRGAIAGNLYYIKGLISIIV